MTTEPQIRYCTTSDGASIAYATLGAGPMVIMLPWVYSFPGRLRVFPSHRALCDAIAGRFTLVQYDGRGTGLSGRERREYDMDARLLDLDAVSRAVSAKTFALFGGHFGGLTAMAYAARHPERVTCLVVADSFASGEQFFRENPVGRVLDALGVVSAEQWPVVTDMMGARFVPDDADLPAARAVAALMRETWDPDAFMAYRQANRETDTAAELAVIAVPTLIVSSIADQASFELSRELATAIPNARLVRVTSHWAGWDERDHATLISFLREHTPPVETAAAPPTSAPATASGAASGMAVILFTDIESNTALLQRLGDERWRAILREHERITREQLAAHGGTEVKHTGDGFMASFGSAAKSLECAVALQHAFAARNAEPDQALRVRIGVNAGEPIAEDGDLFGTAVTMAARIMGEAQGGEVLVSDVVRQLVAGKGFLFADRGEAVLRGFEEPVRLWQLRLEEKG